MDYPRRHTLLIAMLAVGMVWAAGDVAWSAMGNQKPQSLGDAVPPDAQLLDADTQPTLRFPVVHASCGQHALFVKGYPASYGWLVVTRSLIRYEMDHQWPGPADMGSFSVTREQMAKLTTWKITWAFRNNPSLHFDALDKSHEIDYLSPRHWDVAERKQRDDQARMDSVYTPVILRAIQNFDDTVAALRPKLSAPPVVTLSASLSNIQAGQSATLTWTSQNVTRLEIQPGVGAVEASGSRMVTPAESTTYTLTAQGAGGVRSATTQVTVTPAAAPPQIVIFEPSPTNGMLETKDPTLKIRGVAIYKSGMPMVSINGTPANMKPQDAQTAQFWSDPLTLNQGENRFEIVATNRDQSQARQSFVVKYVASAPRPTSKSNAMTKEQILELLKGAVPSPRVAQLVKDRGIEFTPSEDDLNEIRQAGGDDPLIAVIRKAVGPPSQ